jgi:hypothetical protein
MILHGDIGGESHRYSRWRPISSRRISAAQRTEPGCGRAACTCSENASGDPPSAQ